MNIKQFNKIKNKAKINNTSFEDACKKDSIKDSIIDANVSSGKEMFNYLVKIQKAYDDYSKVFEASKYNKYDKKVIELRQKLDNLLNDEYKIVSRVGNLEGKFKVAINGGVPLVNYFDKNDRVIEQYNKRPDLSSFNEFIKKCFAHYGENKQTPERKDMKFLYFLFDSGESDDKLLIKWNGIKITSSNTNQLKKDIILADEHKRENNKGGYDKTDLYVVFSANGKKYKSKIDRIDIGDGINAMQRYFQYLVPNNALDVAYRYIKNYGIGSSGLVKRLDSIKDETEAEQFKRMYNELINAFKKSFKREPTNEELKAIRQTTLGSMGVIKAYNTMRNDSKMKDDYSGFLANFGFAYLKGNGDYEYWYYRDRDDIDSFNKVVTRIRQEYPKMVVSSGTSIGRPYIYIQKSMYKKDSIKDDVYNKNNINYVGIPVGELVRDYLISKEHYKNVEEYVNDKFKNLKNNKTTIGLMKEILKDKYNIVDAIKDVEPRKDESKEEFIARFMNETKSEYPDEKQRYAVANSYWTKRDSKCNDDINNEDLTELSQEELRAIEDYKKAISNTKDVKLLNLYSHILKEEIEHLEELNNAKTNVGDALYTNINKPLTKEECINYLKSVSNLKFKNEYWDAGNTQSGWHILIFKGLKPYGIISKDGDGKFMDFTTPDFNNIISKMINYLKTTKE